MQIKQFFRAAVVTVVALCATPAMAADESCGPDKYIPNGTTNCIPCPTSGTIPDVCTWPFRVTTTADTTQVNFNISASGTFLVDCGGGTLSGPGVSGNTITKAYTTNSSYTCTYANAGARTIKFGGRATGYNNDGTAAAIEFYIQSNNVSRTKVAGISGSLGAIFPTIGTGNNVTQPRFNGTFSGCTNMIGSIPATLFSGISGAPAENMFSDTFSGCSGLTGSIPAGLFSGISGAPAAGMFMETFSGCSGLTGSIPAGLFSDISGAPAEGMFNRTFQFCSGLTGSIPATLFSRIQGAPAHSMFASTFDGCSGLTSIPAGLFSGISGAPAVSMFAGTFENCSGLTGSIPAGLFSGISGAPAGGMFISTFSGCSGLTGSIPAGLFSGISGAPATDMFMETFSGCSGLTGSIPAGLFGTFNGAPANGMFWGTFENCSNLESYVVGGTLPDAPVQNPNWPPYYNTFTGATRMSPTCPANMYDRKPIGETWSITPGRPAVCWPCPPGTHSPAGSTSASACIEEGICEPGYYLPAGTEECVICPQGFWCYGGQFMYDESNDQGINPCPRHSTTAGPGAAFRGQCGTQFCPQTCPAGQITSNCSCVSMDDWARGRLHVKYDGRTYVVHNESDR